MDDDAGTIAPDTKDWTWVLTRPCPECGADVGTVPDAELGSRLLDALGAWPAILGSPDVRRRPGPGTWSSLEYGCHLRDVCRVFVDRLRAVVEEEGPTFADWDQDAAALAGGYAQSDPGVVTDELSDAGRRLADTLDALGPDQLDRPGWRSDGAAFSARTLGQYALHEAVHHTWDARRR